MYSLTLSILIAVRAAKGQDVNVYVAATGRDLYSFRGCLLIEARTGARCEYVAATRL